MTLLIVPAISQQSNLGRVTEAVMHFTFTRVLGADDESPDGTDMTPWRLVLPGGMPGWPGART